MDRKKKLETSLEGLFSKSKGAQKPAEVENKAVPPVPTAVEKLKKSTAAVKKSEPKPADQKDEKKTAKKMAGGQKEADVMPAAAEPQPAAAPVIKAAEAVQKKETTAPQAVETVKAMPKSEPVAPKPEPLAAVESRPAVAEQKVNLALTEVTPSELVVAEAEITDIQLLVFEIDNVQYAIDVSMVQTIIKPQAVFLVPGTAEYLKGLINLRGEVVPVIDLRTRFNLPFQGTSKDTRFVVVKVNDIMASMVVDRVHGVETIPLNLIEKPSSLVMHVDNRYMTGMARYQERIILILDLMHTINPDLVEQH